MLSTRTVVHKLPGLSKSCQRAYALMSNPLDPRQIAKSQANSEFPTPRLLSLDLWGTLFTPKAPVSELYHQVSAGEFGIDKSIQSIENEFPAVFKQMEKDYPNYGKHSQDITNHGEWWLELIARLYQMPSTDSTTVALYERLSKIFEGEGYVLFDDVIPVLKKLQEHNIRVVAATNSDHRVNAVMDHLGISEYFPPGSVHLSYDLGVAKPDRKFFQTIAKKYYQVDLETEGELPMTEFLENCWHVGDHYEKDFAGAVKSGWNGVLLDRKRRSVFLSQPQKERELSNDCFEGQGHESLDGEDIMMISNNRACIADLTQLLRIFNIE